MYGVANFDAAEQHALLVRNGRDFVHNVCSLCCHVGLQFNCFIGEGVPAGLRGDGRMIEPFLLFVCSISSNPPKKMSMLRQ